MMVSSLNRRALFLCQKTKTVGGIKHDEHNAQRNNR